MILRDYQADCITQLRETLRSGCKRIVVSAPCGAGKSVIMKGMVDGAVAKNKRVVFVVDRVVLVKQFSKYLRDGGITYGIIQSSNTWATDRPILVTSIQTITRRGYPDADVVLCDEAHHCVSETYRKMIAHYSESGVPVIGFTATPFSKGLGKLFDRLIVATTIPELIEQGFLVDCDIFAPSGPDMSKVKVVRGDFDEKQAAEAVDKASLVGDIVKHWLRLGRDKSTILFATNILHSKHCCDEFNRHGIRAEHIDAYTDEDERAGIFDRFATGTTKVLCNVDVCSEGYDNPRSEVMILAKPTKSLTRYIQRCGRVLRPYPGKEKALILDHSGSSLELGYPTADLPLLLDMGKAASASKGKAEKKEKLPHDCPHCKYLMPPGIFLCPKCGFKLEAQNKISCAEGKLVPLEKYTTAEKQQFWSEILGIAAARKKDRRWALAFFKDMVGVWPNGLAESPCEPNRKVLGFDIHRRIKFAKTHRSST